MSAARPRRPRKTATRGPRQRGPGKPGPQRGGSRKGGTQRTPARTTYGARAARPYAAALLAALVVGALVIATLSTLAGGGGSGDTAGDAGSTEGAGGETDAVEPLPEDDPALGLARREADDPLALGAADAPLVMIEYADFQDAFVGIYGRNTHDRLVQEYVDAGVLRIEFRNYPINGPESDAAARAAWAAGQQDRFWEFHEAALADEFTMDSGRFEEESLRRIADDAGVPDVDRLLADMETDAAGEAVERDATEAYELGVTGVPSFLINGHPISGAQDLDAFRDVIDPLLAAEEEQ